VLCRLIDLPGWRILNRGYTGRKYEKPVLDYNCRNHLNKYYEGGTVDIVKMREALDALDSTHRGIIIKTGQISVPDHEECTFFHQAFIKYLANSSEIIAKYDELTNYIESHNPGTEVDVDEVDLAVSPLLTKDNELFTTITEAQKVMAKNFKFEME